MRLMVSILPFVIPLALAACPCESTDTTPITTASECQTATSTALQTPCAGMADGVECCLGANVGHCRQNECAPDDPNTP